jgi:HK97 family phage major capsid protein
LPHLKSGADHHNGSNLLLLAVWDSCALSPALSQKAAPILTSKEIRTRISKLLTDQQAIALKGFNTESRVAFDKMQKEVETLEEDFTRTSAMEKRDEHDRSFVRSPRPGIGGSNRSEERTRANAAFRSYAKTGQVDAEYRDILTTGSTGAIVPQLFDSEIVNAVKFYGPVASYVKKKITDGMQPLKVVLQDDTSSGMTLLATEGTSSPAETDPAYSNKLIGADSISTGLILVSFEAFEDSGFDLGELIDSAFGVRYARGIEKAITLGTDSAGTALPNMPTGGLAAAATIAATTGTLAAGITYNNLVTVYGSLDTAYVQNAQWIFNPTVRAQLLGVLDGFGRPLFQPDPTTSQPFAYLMGAPVVLNSAMPVAGVASSQPIILTDLSRTFLLRQQTNPLSILKLSERYADVLSYGFFGWSRIGGAIIAPTSVTAIASLKLASS